MAGPDSLSDQFGPHMGMLAEAVRRDTAKQHGVAHDAPDGPKVTGIRAAEQPRDKYHPQATHHITVTQETPTASVSHVYGVDPSKEYMHNHTTAHVVKTTGRATTYFKPG